MEGDFMKAIKGILSLVVLLSASFAVAEIRQVSTMKEALFDVVTGDVVVFDIDNTILEPAQTLGSDQWFEYLVGKGKQTGLEPQKAIEAAQKDWNRVQPATQVRLVETITAKYIRTLQMRGIVVLALTARPHNIDRVTVDQLTQLNVNFHHYSEFVPQDVGYLEGVLFANGKNKGLVLRDFLNQLHIEPRRLIFIDDKEKNVKNMDAEFSNGPFANINYRYGAADERVKAFSADIAELQWAYFVQEGILISDKVAREMLDNSGLHAVGF